MKISKDKFYGVLVGGVIGDCLGAPFESVSLRKGIKLERIIRKIETVNKVMNYTGMYVFCSLLLKMYVFV